MSDQTKAKIQFNLPMSVAVGVGVAVGMSVGLSIDSWWLGILVSGLTAGATAYVAYLVVSKIFSKPNAQ